jgi:hypothetical protein
MNSTLLRKRGQEVSKRAKQDLRSPAEDREWVSRSEGPRFADGVAATVADFVSLEVGCLIETLSRLGSVTTIRPAPVVSVLRMEVVIDVAARSFRSVEPWACSNKDAAAKPLRAVIAVRGAIVRRDVIVAIGTIRGFNIDAYLSLRFGSACREADCNHGS